MSTGAMDNMKAVLVRNSDAGPYAIIQPIKQIKFSVDELRMLGAMLFQFANDLESLNCPIRTVKLTAIDMVKP